VWEEVVVEKVGYGYLASHCGYLVGSADVSEVFGCRQEECSCEACLCRLMIKDVVLWRAMSSANSRYPVSAD
jgi:hypothetical protein